MNLLKSFEKLKTQVTPYIEKANPYIQKARTYGDKAVEFTTKQVQATPLFLATEEAYNIHITTKRSIVVGFDESDEQVKNLLLLFPIWASKAWIDMAELRYVSIKENKDLAKALKLSGPIEMRVHYNGELFLKTNNILEIKKWWEKRCYSDEDIPENKTNSVIDNDPLSTIK